MITFEDIQKANESIRTTEIKGKEYAEVNQRIKAFRMCYPDGFIETEMLLNENGVCVFKAVVGFNFIEIYGDNGMHKETKIILGTGTAYEKEGSTFINKTSYIENCETSAVGRALGMAGFGIDTSVASFEEVANAIQQQEVKQLIDSKFEAALRQIINDNNIPDEIVIKTLGKYGYKRLNEIELGNYKKICDEIKGE